MEQKYKRRNFFINQDLQGRYMFKVFFFFSICLITCIAVFHIISMDTYTLFYDTYGLEFASSSRALFKKMLFFYLAFIIFGGLALAIRSMFLTHRIAGPLFKMERSIKNMGEGDISSKIYLRKKDEGKELAYQINQFNSNLSRKIELLKKLSSDMEHEIVQNELASTAKLKELNDELMKNLLSFKTMKD